MKKRKGDESGAKDSETQKRVKKKKKRKLLGTHLVKKKLPQKKKINIFNY